MKVPNRDLLIAINENKVAISQCMSMLDKIIKDNKYLKKKVDDSFFRIERKLMTGEL